MKRQRSFDTQQQKTKVGSAGSNGDSGRKCSVNISSANIVHEVQIPDRSGEMQCVRAILDCGATSIFKTPRLFKRLGISSGSIHHHPCYDRRCDATCKGQPEDAGHSPVLGLSRTGRQIRRASRANAGVRSSTWLTMVSQTKS